MGIYPECPECGASIAKQNDVLTQFVCGTRISVTSDGSLRRRQSEICQASCCSNTPKELKIPEVKKYKVVKYN